MPLREATVQNVIQTGYAGLNALLVVLSRGNRG